MIKGKRCLKGCMKLAERFDYLPYSILPDRFTNPSYVYIETGLSSVSSSRIIESIANDGATQRKDTYSVHGAEVLRDMIGDSARIMCDPTLTNGWSVKFIKGSDEELESVQDVVQKYLDGLMRWPEDVDTFCSKREEESGDFDTERVMGFIEGIEVKDGTKRD